jgi:S1-C subfamily serine protease
MTAGMGLAEQAGVEIASLVERVRLSMVRAETSGVGGGSGTIRDASGLIVTNAHVAARDLLQVTTLIARC